jgi:hypothetical protein
MSRKQFLVGLLILLLIPCLVLGGFALYVKWINGFPQKGLVNTSVEPAMVFPWNDAEYSVTYRGDLKIKPEETKAVPNIDIIFLVDVSGSMTSSIPIMADSVYKATSEIARSNPGTVRFSLVRFDEPAEINTPWTDNPEELKNGLNRLDAMRGGNCTYEVVKKLNELLSKTRPDAKKIAVFYTDGYICTNCGEGCDYLIKEAERLRFEGLEIYSVGIPGSRSDTTMSGITGTNEKVLDPGNSIDLSEKIEELVKGFYDSYGSNAQILHFLSDEHFEIPPSSDNWEPLSSDGILKLTKDVGTLPYGIRLTFSHPLKPNSLGLWKVGLKPIHFEFYNNEEQAFTVLPPPREPRILVITWIALFLAALPALIWILKYILGLLQKKEERIQLADPPEIRISPPPARLPALPPVLYDKKPSVPTLFIGLGGTGLQALTDIQDNLKNTHLEDRNQPYRFLHLDTDAKQIQIHDSAKKWEGYHIQQIIAPREISHVEVSQTNIPEHLKWFHAHKYRDLPREKMNLSEGAKGDRALARLALFHWLEKENSEVFTSLFASCEELMALPSPDNTRQIIILASNQGGVGSGWFTDMARLCRRIVRDLQQQEKSAFIPEIIGVLCRETDNPFPENQNALRLEIDSSSLCGAFPHKTCYVSEKSLKDLNQTDTESPFNWVLSAGGSSGSGGAGVGLSKDEVLAQCGELCTSLTESLPRITMLSQLIGTGRPCMDITLNSLRVRPIEALEQVRLDILKRLLGPDVLLDIEAAPNSGFSYKQYTKDQTSSALRQWAESEAQGSPWSLLLLSAVDSQYLPKLTQSFQKISTTPQWFAKAFCASLTRMFHGFKAEDSHEWKRNFYPGLAVSVLHLLEQEMKNRILSDIQASQLPKEVQDNIVFVGKLTESAIENLNNWLHEFNEFFNETFKSLEIQHQQQSRSLNFRKYIDPTPDEKQVQKWTKETFKKWLGTIDSISAIQERLYFEVISEQDKVRIVLRSYIEQAESFSSAKNAGAYIRKIAQILSHQIPAIRIEDILSQLDENSKEQLGRSIVNPTSQPDHLLLTVPTAVQNPKIMGSFVKRIPHPPNHGERKDIQSDDHSALRRFELTEPEPLVKIMTDLPFVEMNEQIAEELRIKAQNKYQIHVPPFPPELRIAVAYPEKFQSFANAYRAGLIVKQQDTAGKQQWYFTHTDQFLTFGDQISLVKAAANYVYYVQYPPQTFADNNKGDFSEIEKWMEQKGAAAGDLLVLIAMEG